MSHADPHLVGFSVFDPCLAHFLPGTLSDFLSRFHESDLIACQVSFVCFPLKDRLAQPE